MVDVISFEQALDAAGNSGKHLLLGNGFSIACKPQIFSYGSLFDAVKGQLPAELLLVFETLGTTDFEVAIKALQASAALTPIYAGAGDGASKLMLQHSELLKEELVKAVAGRHPDRPGEISVKQYRACRIFLANFLAGTHGNVYTTNYDLLLYWSALQSEVDDLALSHNDGFGKDEEDYDAEYVKWHGETRAHGQRVHYLHGALHLFDAGRQLQKYTWVNTGVPLVDQARDALSRNEFPLFVSEADSDQKLTRIQHSAYLHHSYKSYVGVLEQGRNSALFIYGHSFDASDDHILERIARSKLGQVYVSLYGDPATPANQEIVRRAERLKAIRGERFPLFVGYYDAESARVWG